MLLIQKDDSDHKIVRSVSFELAPGVDTSLTIPQIKVNDSDFQSNGTGCLLMLMKDLVVEPHKVMSLIKRASVAAPVRLPDNRCHHKLYLAPMSLSTSKTDSLRSMKYTALPILLARMALATNLPRLASSF